MGTCPDAVHRLIDRFDQQSDQIRSPDYNETLIRVDFINPLMKELGWDIDNSQGFAEQYREPNGRQRDHAPPLSSASTRQRTHALRSCCQICATSCAN